MPYYKNRRRRLRFPFTGLPADIQVQILCGLDLATLRNFVTATPLACSLFKVCPTTILRNAVVGMPLQTRNLLLTTCRVAMSIKHDSENTRPRFENMTAFLEASLDTEERWERIEGVDNDALDVLETFYQIDTEVSSLVEDYAQDIYRRACHREYPYVVPPPLHLSQAEEYRMRRAFYRLKLFGTLFYDFADRFQADLRDGHTSFFDRLSTWEMDELVTAYQFCFRERRYFNKFFKHNNCVYVDHKPWRNEDPFNCRTCRGYFGETSPLQVGPWRTAQPFWHTVSAHYVAATGLWALSAICRKKPVKVWGEIPEVDKPSIGSRSWATKLERHRPVTPSSFVEHFRVLGYCFWDRERIEMEWGGWGGVLGKRWLKLCPICSGSCDAFDDIVDDDDDSDHGVGSDDNSDGG